MIRLRGAAGRGLSRQRRDWAIVASVGLIATALRLALAHYSLWFDEFASLYFAGQPLHRLWSAWMVRETNPPLYYTLLHLWVAAFGLGIVRLRLLSVLGGAAAIAMVFAGLRPLYGRRAAIGAVMMMAASAQQFYFAQQVRAYMFLYLAVAVSFIGLLRIAQSAQNNAQPSRRAWAAYVGGAVAAAYLHTTGLLWPAAATLALIATCPAFRPWHGRRWRALLLANAVIAAAAGWWLWITAQQFGLSGGNLGWMRPPTIGELVWTLRSTILLTRRAEGWQQAIPAALAALALFGAVRTWDRATTRLTVVCLIVAAALFVGLSAVQPILLDRTVFWVSLFPVTLAAAGIGAMARPRAAWAAIAAIVALLSVNLWLWLPTRRVEDWSDPVARLAHDPAAIVLVDGEAISVVLDKACAVELGRAACPFPIVPVAGAGAVFDRWAIGDSRPFAPPLGGPGLFPPGAHAYLLRRSAQDVLRDLHGIGLLGRIPVGSPAFIGPLHDGVLATLGTRARITPGYLRMMSPGAGQPCPGAQARSSSRRGDAIAPETCPYPGGGNNGIAGELRAKEQQGELP